MIGREVWQARMDEQGEQLAMSEEQLRPRTKIYRRVAVTAMVEIVAEDEDEMEAAISELVGDITAQASEAPKETEFSWRLYDWVTVKEVCPSCSQPIDGDSVEVVFYPGTASESRENYHAACASAAVGQSDWEVF